MTPHTGKILSKHTFLLCKLKCLCTFAKAKKTTKILLWLISLFLILPVTAANHTNHAIVSIVFWEYLSRIMECDLSCCFTTTKLGFQKLFYPWFAELYLTNMFGAFSAGIYNGFRRHVKMMKSIWKGYQIKKKTWTNCSLFTSYLLFLYSMCCLIQLHYVPDLPWTGWKVLWMNWQQISFGTSGCDLPMKKLPWPKET